MLLSGWSFSNDKSAFILFVLSRRMSAMQGMLLACCHALTIGLLNCHFTHFLTLAIGISCWVACAWLVAKGSLTALFGYVRCNFRIQHFNWVEIVCLWVDDCATNPFILIVAVSCLRQYKLWRKASITIFGSSFCCSWTTLLLHFLIVLGCLTSLLLFPRLLLIVFSIICCCFILRDRMQLFNLSDLLHPAL